ncbi:MAG: hypothetical protein V1862_09965, partial [Methanobacteriota archaeon]
MIQLRVIGTSIFILCLMAGMAVSGQPVSESGISLNSSGYNTVTDIAGREVTLPANINNVLALYGPAYEKIVILGAEDKIAMCADYHKTHASWAHVVYKALDSLPAMSNPTDPNMEEILKLSP